MECQDNSPFDAFSASAPNSFSSRERSRSLLEQAFDDGMYELKWGYFWWRSMLDPQFRSFCSRSLFCDPAITLIKATGHQLATFCCFFLCWRAGTDSWPDSGQASITCFHRHISFPFLVLFPRSARFLPHTHGVSCDSQNISFHAHSLFTGWDDVLSRLEQAEQTPSPGVPRLGDTGDTGRDEAEMGEPRQRMSFKRTYKMK